MTFSHLFPLIHWQHWDKKTQRRQDRCENTKNHSSAAFLRAATGNWLRKVQMENTFRLSAASHFLCSRSLYLLSQWKYLWVQYIYIFWHAGFCLFDVLFIKRCVCFASVYALNSSSFFSISALEQNGIIIYLFYPPAQKCLRGKIGSETDESPVLISVLFFTNTTFPALFLSKSTLALQCPESTSFKTNLYCSRRVLLASSWKVFRRTLSSAAAVADGWCGRMESLTRASHVCCRSQRRVGCQRSIFYFFFPFTWTLK